MVGLLCAAIVISGTALYLTYRQPEVCSLCGSGNRERYQAPVILNLTTGQSNEIRIYDPNFPFSKYEIAPIQTTGIFSFASCAGYTGRRDTCSHTCTVDLPIETKGLKVSHFCSDCRVLLKDHAENGFVLADLYVEDAIDIYPATVGADYTIRDYDEIYNKHNRSYFEALEVKAEEMAKKYDCVFADNEMPYGRVPQGHPVIVDYFYHEEIRGTENTGKRNR